jgi:sulfur carrier protein
MSDSTIHTITVNGKPREVPAGATLESLVADLGLDKSRIAAEVNREIVRKADYSNTLLKPDDRIEIVTFVGGG